MRINKNTVLLTLFAWILSSAVFADSAEYDNVAKRIVNQSLNVRPGEIVLIQGNPSEIELMGALQVAVAGAGGDPVVLLNIPAANKRTVMEISMDHLGRTRSAQLTLMRMADATINVSSIEDPMLFADVPEERLAATRRANAALNEGYNNTSVRSVTLGQTGGIPTAAYARSIGANPKEITDMFWKAVSIDPDALTMTARKIASMLQPGAKAKLTNSDGTDISFAIDNVPARINAGRVDDAKSSHGPSSVWLPAGEAYTSLDVSSANGTVVVPHMTFRGNDVKNLRLSFRDGQLSNLSADSNEKMLKDYFAASDAPSARLSVMSVGLNGNSKPLNGSHYRSWEMGGMVTVAMGNNTWAGGSNSSDGGLTMHLAGATLEVGKTRIVDGGELAKVR